MMNNVQHQTIFALLPVSFRSFIMHSYLSRSLCSEPSWTGPLSSASRNFPFSTTHSVTFLAIKHLRMLSIPPLSFSISVPWSYCMCFPSFSWNHPFPVTSPTWNTSPTTADSSFSSATNSPSSPILSFPWIDALLPGLLIIISTFSLIKIPKCSLWGYGFILESSQLCFMRVGFIKKLIQWPLSIQSSVTSTTTRRLSFWHLPKPSSAGK